MKVLSVSGVEDSKKRWKENGSSKGEIQGSLHSGALRLRSR
jgi:hypothetical protein